MRRPLTTLAALVAASVLLAGCGEDSGDAADDPSSPASSSSTAGESSTPPLDPNTEAPVPPESEDPDDSDDDPAPPADEPADAADLCSAFRDFGTALSTAPVPTEGPDSPLAPETIDALHQWGEDLEAAELPADFTDDQRAGVAAMVKALDVFPDTATVSELDALEDVLSEEEQDQAEAVSDYVEATCAVPGVS
ncbi:hypothetical protein FE634_21780 [Nocardioides dongxiaopingii]|uniref:hypothetical protein n=1 Tax=Nocardioides sp. S-1144 TaxID=2582905 RepID=UPI0011635482|nr:hypothetical protein [Nocardioides sp. S-1144]QDH10938.1 hypothetical protein FE634_21780 [Nocardioides sp. S-1144]